MVAHDILRFACIQYVEVNALKLASPHQAYSILWHALSGKHAAPTRAAQLLEQRFSTSSSRRVCTVLLVDELDYLVTRKQTVRVVAARSSAGHKWSSPCVDVLRAWQVLYNLFEWPTRRNSRLIVVGIANTMDLPERLLPKIHSRLGLGRIVFAPYVVAPRLVWMACAYTLSVVGEQVSARADPRDRSLSAGGAGCLHGLGCGNGCTQGRFMVG